MQISNIILENYLIVELKQRKYNDLFALSRATDDLSLFMVELFSPLFLTILMHIKFKIKIEARVMAQQSSELAALP